MRQKSQIRWNESVLFFSPFTFWEGYLAGTFTGISTAISDQCYGLAFLSEAFYFHNSSWLPARGFRLLDFVRVTLWLRSSSLYSFHFSLWPWASTTIRQHADPDSTILASPSTSNFLSFHDLQRPRVSTFPSPSRVLPDLPDLPFYPSHACNFFIIVYRRWMSGRRVFWLVDEFLSLLPIQFFPRPCTSEYEFELAALFSPPSPNCTRVFFLRFSPLHGSDFSYTSISLLSSAWSYASRL